MGKNRAYKIKIKNIESTALIKNVKNYGKGKRICSYSSLIFCWIIRNFKKSSVHVIRLRAACSVI